MGERLLKALASAGRTFNNPFSESRAYTLPRRGDSQKDLRKIVGDMRKVGSDLRKVSEQELAKNRG